MSDTKRLYFDDGKSRKRWQVHTKGKSQIVHYGRLSGTLRESRKYFKSLKEAAEQTQKLIAKKKREGYVEVNPSRLEITRIKRTRRATETQIKAIEKRIGCNLPDEYRNFLKTTNGGHPNPDCVQVPGARGIDNVCVGAIFHLQPSKPGGDELSFELENSGQYLPSEHLPIAGSSDIFSLSLNPKTFGCVYWWNHETDEVDEDEKFLASAGYLLAGSFDEFLTRIALLYGDDDEEEAEPTPQRSAAKKSQSGLTKTKSKATTKRLLRLISHDLTPDKVKEIQQVIKELGDLSGIQDGDWPFINIRNPRIVRSLMKAGLNPEMTDTDGHSLLWQCASNRECIDLLVERGVNIDRRSGNESETALMRAMYAENIPAVQRLLQLGANPTVRLDWPIQNKLDENAKLRKIIEKSRTDWKKKKAKKPTRATVTPKKAAQEKKKGPKPTIRRLLRLMKHDVIFDESEEIEEIEELITELRDLSEIEDGQWPSIHKFESPRLLSSLLDAGLNPEITDKEGKSLLCQCVVHPDCIDLLIEHGVKVDRRSGKGNETALMRAAWIADEDCIERLLEAGANPTLEFSSFAKVILGLNDEKSEIIESAREKWKRSKKRKTKKATRKKK